MKQLSHSSLEYLKVFAWKVETHHMEVVKGVGGWGKDRRYSKAHLLVRQYSVGFDQQWSFSLGNFTCRVNHEPEAREWVLHMSFGGTIVLYPDFED